jgi:hypothetical protein
MMTVTSTVGCNRKAAHTSAALVFLFNLLTFESCSPYFCKIRDLWIVILNEHSEEVRLVRCQGKQVLRFAQDDK